MRKREYSVLQPPYFMNRDMMAGVAQLEQFDEELYKVTNDEGAFIIKKKKSTRRCMSTDGLMD